jgi:hypothetical protein
VDEKSAIQAFGPAGPGASAVTGKSGAAWIRVLSPRHPCRCTQHWM